MNQTMNHRIDSGKIVGVVYYQDFYKNVDGHFDCDKLILDLGTAVRIGSFAFEVGTRDQFAEDCFRALNTGFAPHIPVGLFKKAGHTSMSVGDFIMFEDGEILLCQSIGWKKLLEPPLPQGERIPNSARLLK